MRAALVFLTSRKTTACAVLGSLALLLGDAQFVGLLHDAGLTTGASTKLVALSKVALVVLAALGYSPLTKPEPQYRRRS